VQETIRHTDIRVTRRVSCSGGKVKWKVHCYSRHSLV